MQPVPKPFPSKITEPAAVEQDLSIVLRGLQENAERWTRLEEQIKSISADDDLEVVKAQLCAEVAAARAATLQEPKKITALLMDGLSKRDVAGIETGTQDSPLGLDPLTGLPVRAYAESELSRAQVESADCYLALFIVKRLSLINAKFGYSRGDQVLLKIITQLAQSLPEFKSLFRWSPCAFLAIAPPNISYKELRSKVHAIEITRMTPVLEWEGRSAMVPVTLDCRILSLKDFAMLSDLFLRLDTLAADV